MDLTLGLTVHLIGVFHIKQETPFQVPAQARTVLFINKIEEPIFPLNLKLHFYKDFSFPLFMLVVIRNYRLRALVRPNGGSFSLLELV